MYIVWWGIGAKDKSQKQIRCSVDRVVPDEQNEVPSSFMPEVTIFKFLCLYFVPGPEVRDRVHWIRTEIALSAAVELIV